MLRNCVIQADAELTTNTKQITAPQDHFSFPKLLLEMSVHYTFVQDDPSLAQDGLVGQSTAVT